MKPIPAETLMRLRAKMHRTASYKGHPHPDDIAQEYVMRLLEGYHEKATIDQAYVDICRLSSGRKGQPGYDAKRTLNMVASSDEQVKFYTNQPNPFEDFTIDDRLDLEKILSQLDCPRLIHIFTMRLKGFTLAEIGRDLKLTESRINQIVNREILLLRSPKKKRPMKGP